LKMQLPNIAIMQIFMYEAGFYVLIPID
jgi:hypothetical protein